MGAVFSNNIVMPHAQCKNIWFRRSEDRLENEDSVVPEGMN